MSDAGSRSCRKCGSSRTTSPGRSKNPAGVMMLCTQCGHSWLAPPPPREDLATSPSEVDRRRIALLVQQVCNAQGVAFERITVKDSAIGWQATVRVGEGEPKRVDVPKGSLDEMRSAIRRAFTV